MSLLLLSLVAIPSPHVMLISLPLCYSVYTITVHTQNNCFNTFLNEFSRVRYCTFVLREYEIYRPGSTHRALSRAGDMRMKFGAVGVIIQYRYVGSAASCGSALVFVVTNT